MFNSLLSDNGYKGTKYLLELDFTLQISEEFLSCMDKQLTKLFINTTEISMQYPIGIHWLQENGFHYQRGVISSVNSLIFLKHGSIEPNIMWKSKSGKIYEIADTDIDCEDIEFWFEGLDIKHCKFLMKPDFTLFTLPLNEKWIKKAFKGYLLNVSTSFLQCADNQLTTIFTKLIGLKPNLNLCLQIPSFSGDVENIDVKRLLEYGTISKLKITLYVNHNWNEVVVLWKSKSRRIYKIDDEDIDCNDIEFWFEHLDTVLYTEQVYPKGAKLPFSTKNLPFEVVVERLNLNAELTVVVNNENVINREQLINSIYLFIDNFNAESEKKNREEGVVHNCNGNIENRNDVKFEIDLGSVGFGFYKKLIKHLTKQGGIVKVLIG